MRRWCTMGAASWPALRRSLLARLSCLQVIMRHILPIGCSDAWEAPLQLCCTLQSYSLGLHLADAGHGHATMSDFHNICWVMAVYTCETCFDIDCAGVELRGLHKRGETLSKLYTWALSLHREGTTWLIDGVEQLLGM